MKIQNYNLSMTTDLSANQQSTYEDLSQDYGFSAQVQITGTALNGTFKLQSTNIFDAGAPAHWVDVPSSSQAVSGLTGNLSLLWNIDAAYYNYVRIVWTNSSGTGTLNHCKMVVKG